MTNSVFTIYELTNGDDFQGESKIVLLMTHQNWFQIFFLVLLDFSGMDLPVLLKALETLEVAGKAEVMCDGEGVKFF